MSKTILTVLAAVFFWSQHALGAEEVTPPAPPANKIANDTCLACHGNAGFAMPGPDGKPRSLHVAKDKFADSSHGKKLSCHDCHSDITAVPHAAPLQKVNCVACHESMLATAKKEGKTEDRAKMAHVGEQIQNYLKSVHAQPRKDDPTRVKATCSDCHNAHYVYPKDSPGRMEWRLAVPDTCGKCHAQQRADYATSVHGNLVLEKKLPVAAVCSDCHTPHSVQSPGKDSTQVAITRNCGNCHTENYKSYAGTYHGQVNTLGYAHTAKCFDCHGSHKIKRPSDPESMVHPNNRLETCKQCHKEATAGFVTFEPHGHAGDFERYPYIWLASFFMFQLLAGTFAFFWTHTALWFYREYKERKEHKTRPHVLASAVPHGQGKYFRRWPAGWRIMHLLFALSLMTLTLTGMAVFYADTFWAPYVMMLLGGPKNAAIIHRVCAVIFATVFIIHLIYMVMRIGKNWRTFEWFGPNSMVPRLQDLWDVIAMFKWFFGLGPRPIFDRWTYWEKFDYWAPFWGVTIIGVSGVMLWFPEITASYLPGWVFNIATIFHGEEALLAALFLFTVHFFNNHFRPDKFPLDIQIFTGAVPLEEFRKEHTVEYNRLVQSGELSKYLVDAPTQPMTRAARILGFTLIAFGLILLMFVVTGAVGDILGH